jgi:hypothetical protein
MSEQEPVRIPREVLEELESVRRYTRAEVLDIPTIRRVAMERQAHAGGVARQARARVWSRSTQRFSGRRLG